MDFSELENLDKAELIEKIRELAGGGVIIDQLEVTLFKDQSYNTEFIPQNISTMESDLCR